MKAKRLISLILSLIMCVPFVASAVTVSFAGDSTIENLFVADGYGTPASNAGGDMLPNLNFYCGKNIKVTAGDKIYLGPCLRQQGFQISYYGSTSGTLKSTASDIVMTPFPNTENMDMLCYTVPQGVTSITPVFSQIFEDVVLVTKNQEITPDIYFEYWEAKGVDAKTLLGKFDSTEVSSINNVFATGGVFDGRAAHGKGLLTDAAYKATNGFVEAPAGSIVSFVGDKAQGYHLTLYKSDKTTSTTNVNANYLIHTEDVGGGYMIYTYVMRSDSNYVRLTVADELYNAGMALLTVNQPFDEETYRAWCKAQGATPDSIIGSGEDKTPYDQLVNLFDAENAASGYENENGVTADENYVHSGAITVNAGSRLMLGPVDTKMTSPLIVTYNESAAFMLAVKASELSTVTTLESGNKIFSYTVPEGVASVKVNFPAQNKQYLLVVKDQNFDRYSYDQWYASTVAEGDNIYNPMTTLYGAYTSTSTAVKTDAKYNATAYIPVKEGDTVYAGALWTGQSIPGVAYDEQFNPIVNIAQKNLSFEFNISGSVGMLKYKVPSGVAYVRFIPRSSFGNAVWISKNKSVTYEKYIETFGINIPTHDESSVLNGKNALFVGDSITFGSGEDGTFWVGWPDRIAAMTGLIPVNCGDSGARISLTGSSGFIRDGLAISGKFDYDMVVIHGGVNDAINSIPVGNITPEGTTSFDTATFAGGLELVFMRAKALHKNADLFYVTNYRLDGFARGNAQNMSPYFDMAKKICEKWGVTVIDLYDNKELNDKLEVTTKKYLPDLLHANGAGYDIISPYIAEALEAFYTPDEPETDTTTTVADVTTDTQPSDSVSASDTTTAEPDDATTQVLPDDTAVRTPDSDTTGTDEKKEKSCSGFASVATLALLVAACFGVAIFIKKK